MRARVVLPLAAVAVATAALAVSPGIRSVTLHLGQGFSIARDPGGQARRLVLDTSPELVADHYPAAARDGHERPLLVLVHGSEPEGRRHFVYRVLAGRLAADGFPVIALDLRGFGESEEPSEPLADHLRFGHDVAAVAEHAVSRGLAKPGRIVYVGHSLGAAVALRAAGYSPQPAAVVALGTPPVRDRARREGAAGLRTFASRRLKDMGRSLDEPSIRAMERCLLDLDPDALRTRGVPVPALFVYGEEEVAGRTLPTWGAPHEVIVIPGSDHRYTIEQGPWGLTYYERRALRELSAAIGDWAESWGS